MLLIALPQSVQDDMEWCSGREANVRIFTGHSVPITVHINARLHKAMISQYQEGMWEENQREYSAISIR